MNLKRSILILFCLANLFYSRSQVNFSAYKPIVLTLKVPPKEKAGYSTPFFNHFQVMDERPDTARVGVHANSRTTSHPKNRQWVFPQGLSREVETFLNAGFTASQTEYSALIVVRAFWIADANYIREEMLKDPEKRADRIRIRLKAEIYVVKDSNYMPLFRFDSLQVTSKNSYWNLDTDVSQYLAEILGELADSSAFLAAQKINKLRHLTLDDIRRFNQTRFQAPICRDSQLVKGVYTSFQEFRNNDPLIRDFEIHTEKKKQYLYLKDGEGHTNYSHTAWGYCDGKTVYIMRDGALRPTCKEGNSFYLFGNASLTAKEYGYVYNDPNNGRTVIGQPYNDPLINNQSSGSLPSFKPGGAAMGAGLLASGLLTELLDNTKTKVLERIFAVDMDSGAFY
ncbi:hypothetical protein ACX0G9_28610 [Flavitalea flava]